ncbi:transmembrane protein, putative [Medicago truncatula]|uniref:Transmembrane protein, putative n=1 Tax=Medicago truncatula TaxID=3880 RepID=A0A072UR67_MEDTR|nr:transmembrane protein, putative [Medicago truncatula]
MPSETKVRNELLLARQICAKHCSQAERDEVFEELRPHFLNLAYNAYAVHLVKKTVDNANVLLERNNWQALSLVFMFMLLLLFVTWLDQLVSTGRSGGILHPFLDDKINSLHKAIASLAAVLKSEDSQEEHVLENFFSRCREPISYVLFFSAFLESSDSKVQNLAEKELQP